MHARQHGRHGMFLGDRQEEEGEDGGRAGRAKDFKEEDIFAFL